MVCPVASAFRRKYNFARKHRFRQRDH